MTEQTLPSGQQVDILVVEDSLVEAELLRRVLVKAGYRVTLAKNGEDGLQALKEHLCALVISDIRMPLMDGYELCREIKHDENLWHIPVILVSVLSEAEDIINALNVGADSYLTKPCVEASLLARIHSLLAPPIERSRLEERRAGQVEYNGKHYTITTGSRQTLNLLLSVYENTLSQNRELVNAQAQLNRLNNVLEDQMQERTAALQESEARYRHIRSVTQTANDAIITSDSAGNIVDWNPSAERLFGYTEAEIIGQAVTRLMPERYIEQHSAGLARVAAGGVTHLIGKTVEFAGLRKDGSEFPMEFSLAQWQTGAGQFFCAIIRDITERKQAEESLRNMATKFRSVFESSSDAIFLSNEKGFIDCNPVALLMFGCTTRDEIIGKHPADLSPSTQPGGEDSMSMANERIATAFRDGSTQFEWIHRRFDGTEFPADVLLTAMELNGKPVLQATVRDITNRKLAEAKISASELRYRCLFESAKDGILILDAETGMVVDVNPFLIEMLGYSHEEFLGKVIWELGFFRDILANKDNFLELQQQAYIRYEDLPLETVDGRVFHVEFVSNVYLVGGNKVIQCNIRDITERRQVALALAEKETRLRTLVQTIPDLIWLKDENGVFLSCNRGFERLLGTKEADIIGKTDYDFVDQELADFFREHDRMAMAAGKPSVNSEWLTFSEGGYHGLFETIKTPMYDAGGELVGVLGIARDITGRRQAEEQLRESEARYKRITEGLTDYQYTVRVENGHAVDTLHSPGCETVTGYTSEDFAANPYLWIEIVVPEDRDRVREYAQQILAGKDIPPIEYRIIRKDGETRWVSNTIIFFRAPSGKLQSYDGVIKDITEGKNLDKVILERRNEMEYLQKIQVADQTAAAIAHELNQPLLAIALYSKAALKMMKSEKPDYAEISKAIEGSERQAQRAGQSIRELLTLLRSKEFPPETFDLNQEVLNILDAAKSEHELQFDSILRLEEGLPLILANRTQIQKVLLNLLNNSIEAMQEAGVPLPSITVTACKIKEENVAQVTIRDNGPGLNKEYSHRLFEPFFTTKPTGIGMGLVISRSLIEANGGRLWAEPQEGFGATFHFTLPFAI